MGTEVILDVTRIGDWYSVQDYRVVPVRLPVTIETRDALDGRAVRIDGALYRVRGLEVYLHSPPWREGEKCGMAVVPV